MLSLDGFSPATLHFEDEHPSVLWRHSDGREQATNLGRFYPHRIGEGVNSGALRVDWADILDMPIHSAFYDLQIKHAAESEYSGKRLQTGWDDLVQVSRHCPAVRFSGMIFHAARSGSTLLHRMINQLPSAVSFCEPSVLHNMMGSTLAWDDHERAAGLQALLRVLARSKPIGDMSRTVVKFNDIMALDIGMVRRVMPDVPCLFLYRDPLEILVSLVRKQTGTTLGWQENREGWATYLGIPELAAEDMLLDEATARILGRIFSSVADSAESNTSTAPLLLVDYRALSNAFVDRIASLFGFSLSPDDIAGLDAEIRLYSKSEEVRQFVPDSAEKRQAATPRMRQLIDTFVASSAERCRRLCV